MWFGTSNGLYRFDGTNVLYTHHVNGDTNSLSNNDAYSNPAGTTSGTFSSIADLYTSDPMFVSSTDFHLQSGSPVKAVGNPAYTPPLDFDGQARPSASLGAYR